MKAETALITINGVAKLHVTLIPEDEKDLVFLKDALEKADGFKVSASLGVEKLG